MILVLHTLLLNGFAQRDRNRRRRRIAIMLNIAHEFVSIQAQLARGRLQDAQIGLMRDHQIDFCSPGCPLPSRFARCFR